MPTLTRREIPADVAEIVADVANYLGVRVADLFVADHHHGDVRTEGAYSIAYEGAYDWPFLFSDDRWSKADAEGRRDYYLGRFLDAVNGAILGVYPTRGDDIMVTVPPLA